MPNLTSIPQADGDRRTLRDRAVAERAAYLAQREADEQASRADKRRQTLDEARRWFKYDLGIDIDEPSVIYFWTSNGRDLRVTVDGGLLIAFNDDYWQGYSRYSLVRQCTRAGCQHISDAIRDGFSDVTSLGRILEADAVHSKDCTVEWDEEGEPIRPAKPKAQKDIATEIAEDLGIVIGTAPEWFLQYQLRVSSHVAKLHSRINEVAAHPALSIPPL